MRRQKSKGNFRLNHSERQKHNLLVIGIHFANVGTESNTLCRGPCWWMFTAHSCLRGDQLFPSIGHTPAQSATKGLTVDWQIKRLTPREAFSSSFLYAESLINEAQLLWRLPQSTYLTRPSSLTLSTAVLGPETLSVRAEEKINDTEEDRVLSRRTRWI